MYKRLNIIRGRATLLVFLLALLALGAILAFSINTWQADWQLTHHREKPKVIIPQNDNDEVAALIDAIPKAHLFGEALSAVGNMPLTNLQLHLTGIVHSNHGSKAYISISTQPSKIYHTGDELAYGAKIFAITDDTVVLQNAGRLEKITLARQKLEFKMRNKPELSS